MFTTSLNKCIGSLCWLDFKSMLARFQCGIHSWNYPKPSIHRTAGHARRNLNLSCTRSLPNPTLVVSPRIKWWSRVVNLWATWAIYTLAKDQPDRWVGFEGSTIASSTTGSTAASSSITVLVPCHFSPPTLIGPDPLPRPCRFLVWASVTFCHKLAWSCSEKPVALTSCCRHRFCSIQAWNRHMAHK